MVYTFLYILFISVIFLSAQTIVSALSTHAIFASISMLFAAIYGLSQERRLPVVLMCGIFVDIFAGSFFGLYTIFFLSIATLYEFLTKNIIRTHNIAPAKLAIITVLGIFFLTLLHDKIVFDIELTMTSVAFVAFGSAMSLILFFLMTYFLRKSEYYFMRIASPNRKKHT